MLNFSLIEIILSVTATDCWSSLAPHLANVTSCCNAMESYMSRLQEQSFINNLQAENCASLPVMKLQGANISSSMYNLYHIKLKDFSPQVYHLYSPESGCLLPSLPSDVTFNGSFGIGFICDLNDNIVASWPVVLLFLLLPAIKLAHVLHNIIMSSAAYGLLS
ncbi:unnamed protein product [Coffea canephora]|uniref:At1g61900-like C-terminal domain-containing protein n=1 Tax=Coffea canephora TaxID=49390 RepID=A0A068V964_COFCA|nr:unnamed protein product [Coffea canephora]